MIEGRASCALRRLGETVAGAFHFVNRGGPRAMQLQDLGATHQALTAEADEIRLRRAPSIERGRPFVRAPEIEDFMAGLDHAAIDVAGGNRRYLAGGHRSHRFIQQRHALGHSLETDQGSATSVQRHRDQTHVGKAPSDVGRLAKQRVRPVGITFHHTAYSGRHEEIAVHDALGPFAEDALCPRDPPTAPREVTAVE